MQAEAGAVIILVMFVSAGNHCMRKEGRSAGAEYPGQVGFSAKWWSLILHVKERVLGGKQCKPVNHTCTCLEKRLCFLF